VFEEILAMIERSTPERFAAQQNALLARPDARPVFAALRCPTLLVCGRQDAWSPLERHERMQQALPHARLVVIEDAGHMTTLEQPEAVSSALLQWAEAGLTGR
jgi:pimeloyl-ACP methyl ester carboxylesterase